MSLLAEVADGVELVRLLAVDLAEQLLQKAQTQMVEKTGQQTTSLNITKKGFIESSGGPFQGCYIDNLFFPWE